MRLPYIDDNSFLGSKSEQAIVDRVKQRRGGNLIALDKALLHAPLVADGWNSFLGSIRTGTTLSASLRETAICRVAVLNRAWYEWEQHAPILEEAGEITADGFAYLKSRPRADASRKDADAALPDRKHVLVVEYTDAMTLDCKVEDVLFEELRQTFNDRAVVEITSTIAAYNCVSRFLVALDVEKWCSKSKSSAHKARPAKTNAPSPTTAPGTPRPVGAAAPVNRVDVELVVVVDAVVLVVMVVGLVVGGTGVLLEVDVVTGFVVPVPEDAARLLLRVPELTGFEDETAELQLAVAVTVTVCVYVATAELDDNGNVVSAVERAAEAMRANAVNFILMMCLVPIVDMSIRVMNASRD